MDPFIMEVIEANNRLRDLLDRAVQDLATRDGVTVETARTRLGWGEYRGGHE